MWAGKGADRGAAGVVGEASALLFAECEDRKKKGTE